MCMILLAWQAHPEYPLIIAANRDEFYDRPAASAGFWPDAPEVLAGRDLKAGGAWLGVTRQGRFAALTNYRNGSEMQRSNAPSRGALVADFLRCRKGWKMPKAYLRSLEASAHAYNGFNLLVGDLLAEGGPWLGYLSNRAPTETGIRRTALRPGIYGLSNHLLDTPWPKLSAAKAAFARVLARLPENLPGNFSESAALFELLADKEIAPDTRLPRTGVSLARERMLSAVFVKSPDYGTRASTLIVCRRDGAPGLQMRFIEHSFGRQAEVTGEVEETFRAVLPVVMR